jgi:SOS-response transcriptional repressor LexA
MTTPVYDTIDLPHSVFPEPDLFAFGVVGDSMTGDDIRDGDFIVVAPGPAADGDIAVVEYATPNGRRGRVVKHVRHDGDALVLESSNPACPPKIITPEVVPVIEGVVVGVARVQDGTWTHFRLHPPPEAPCTSGQ